MFTINFIHKKGGIIMSVRTFDLTLIWEEETLSLTGPRIELNKYEIIQHASELGATVVDYYNIRFSSLELCNKLLNFITRLSPLGGESESKKEEVVVYVNDIFTFSTPKNGAIKENWAVLTGDAKYFKAQQNGNKFYFKDSHSAKKFINILTNIAFGR